MGTALEIRADLASAAQLRALARRKRSPRTATRMLPVAAALEEASRAEAARLAGMECQAPRDAVVRYNAEGLEGLRDRPKPGRPPALSEAEQVVALQPPDPADAALRRRRVAPGEVVIEIAQAQHWLWRAVGRTGMVLDMSVQSGRDKRAAERPLLEWQYQAPPVVVTDELGGCGAAEREPMPSVGRRRHKGLNNRAEAYTSQAMAGAAGPNASKRRVGPFFPRPDQRSLPPPQPGSVARCRPDPTGTRLSLPLLSPGLAGGSAGARERSPPYPLP